MNLFKSDLIRFYGKDCLTMKELLLFPYELRWLWSFRMASKYKRNKFLFLPFYILYRHYTKVSQIQVPIGTKIGAGFYIGHVGNNKSKISAWKKYKYCNRCYYWTN